MVVLEIVEVLVGVEDLVVLEPQILSLDLLHVTVVEAVLLVVLVDQVVVDLVVEEMEVLVAQVVMDLVALVVEEEVAPQVAQVQVEMVDQVLLLLPTQRHDKYLNFRKDGSLRKTRC